MIESWYKCAKCKQWFFQYMESPWSVTTTSTQVCLCDDCKLADHGIDWNSLIVNNHKTFTRVVVA